MEGLWFHNRGTNISCTETWWKYISQYLKNELNLLALGEQLQMMSISAIGKLIHIKSDALVKKEYDIGETNELSV